MYLILNTKLGKTVFAQFLTSLTSNFSLIEVANLLPTPVPFIKPFWRLMHPYGGVEMLNQLIHF